MSQSFKNKIDSLLDNDADISSAKDPSGVATHGGASHARVLIFVLPNGDEQILHYSYLVTASFQAENGRIILTFTSHSVKIEGLRLHSLFRDFSRHEPHIVEAVESRYGSLADDKGPCVTIIEILEL